MIGRACFARTLCPSIRTARFRIEELPSQYYSSRHYISPSCVRPLHVSATLRPGRSRRISTLIASYPSLLRGYTTTKMDVSLKAGHELLSFINASPTPFHAVNSIRQKLENAGFQRLNEKDSWCARCTPGGKYYVTRNASTIIAFAVGKRWRPGNPIAMIGARMLEFLFLRFPQTPNF